MSDNSPPAKMTPTVRPGRPFGLRLAIGGSSALFGLMPMLYGLLLLYINNTIYSNQTMLSGLELEGLSLMAVYAQLAAAGLFLLAAAATWRGKPAWMRVTFSATVLIYTALTLTAHITRSTPTLDSSMGVRGWLDAGYIILLLLNALYVTWYLRRWPARAFFRGHYTEDDLTQLQQSWGGAS